MPELKAITPYLTVRGAKAAAEFYQRAFGAEEVRRQEADDGERLLPCPAPAPAYSRHLGPLGHGERL